MIKKISDIVRRNMDEETTELPTSKQFNTDRKMENNKSFYLTKD